jgi:hypothetical protein
LKTLNLLLEPELGKKNITQNRSYITLKIYRIEMSVIFFVNFTFKKINTVRTFPKSPKWQWLVFSLLVIGTSCSKKSEEPVRGAQGTWAYTTPDKLTNISFQLVRTETGQLEMRNPFHSSANGPIFGNVESVNLTNITRLEVSKACGSPHCSFEPVLLLNGRLSADENKLLFATGSYYHFTGHYQNLTPVFDIINIYNVEVVRQ